LHKYIYANSNPSSFTDPSGLFAALAESNAAFAVFAILATIKFAGITTGSYNPERLGGIGADAQPRTVLDGLFAWRNTWSPEPLGGIGAGSSPSLPSHTGRSVGDINDFVRHIFSIHIDIAYDIAFGHTWDKHKEEWEEIGIASEQELAEHIETIMMIPSESKTEGERTAYWDDNTGTIVIENPNDPDGRTAFRPNKEYFRRWPKTGR
jgi:hypothetical protein